MGQFSIKVRHNDKNYYFRWSGVVDAPIFGTTSLDALKAYIRERYGSEGIEARDRDGSWDRLETTGVSIPDYDSPRRAVAYNRAGPNETCLSYEELLDVCCREIDEDETTPAADPR